MNDKIRFANTIHEHYLDSTALSVMNDCEKYGMISGCDEYCPQLERGECEIYSSVEEYLSEKEGK